MDQNIWQLTSTPQRLVARYRRPAHNRSRSHRIVQAARRFLAGLLLLAFAGFTGIAGATEAKPYPWDMRQPKCKLPERAAHPDCVANDWPTFNESLERLRTLADMGEFALLERAFAELSVSEKSYPTGVPVATTVYWAIQNIVVGLDSMAPQANRLAPWKQQFPASRFVLLADALLQFDRAWKIRGSGAASTVSPEAWRLFAMRLREAEQLLLKAPPEIQNIPAWHHVLLVIELNLPDPQIDGGEVFKNAVKRWPRYLPFYTTVLWKLEPRWGGSWELTEKFVDYWSSQLESTDGVSMYARLYSLLNESEFTFASSRINWPRLKTSFEDLIKRYPTEYHKLAYAGYACFARDKVAFREAMALLPKGPTPLGGWLPGHSQESCELWVAQ